MKNRASSGRGIRGGWGPFGGRGMVERFLKYSLEREQKICAVLLEDGKMSRKNLLVTAIDEDGQGFSACLPGRKREAHFSLDNVLTATYARGDQGELE